MNFHLSTAFILHLVNSGMCFSFPLMVRVLKTSPDFLVEPFLLQTHIEHRPGDCTDCVLLVIVLLKSYFIMISYVPGISLIGLCMFCRNRFDVQHRTRFWDTFVRGVSIWLFSKEISHGPVQSAFDLEFIWWAEYLFICSLEGIAVCESGILMWPTLMYLGLISYFTLSGFCVLTLGAVKSKHHYW